MSRPPRFLTILCTAMALMLIGTTGASAWTYATKSSPQRVIVKKKSHGDSAGTIARYGYNIVKINVNLKYPAGNTGHGTYQYTQITFPGNPNTTPGFYRTGNRKGSTWAKMKEINANTHRSSMGAYSLTKVCEDIPMRPDPCSSNRGKYL